MVLLGGCSGLDPRALGAANDPGFGDGAAARSWRVYGEDKISGEYQIDNAGSLSLPLAKTIAAAGLTKPELEQELTTPASEVARGAVLRIGLAHLRPIPSTIKVL
jgi:protein involved in polysaccharide export with SLBB domain